MAEVEPGGAEPSEMRRIALGAGVLGLLGFLAGAGANQALKQVFATPEDAADRSYVDKEEGERSEPVARVADGPGPGEEDGPVRSTADALGSRFYTTAIGRRNIFDSAAVYDPNAAKVADGGFECRESKSRLLGTVVADPPEYSSALIIDGGGKDARATGYVLGEEVSGEGRIVSIEQNRVCLDGGSCLCIGQEGKPVADAGAAGEDGGVEKLSDNKYRVSQSFLNDALSNVEALATKVRAVPHKTDGEIDGFRLSAIRKGSLFEKLGIKNGDIIHNVNGSPLTSAESALSSYTSLKNEKSFTFEITRRNQRQTLEYEVR